MKKRLDGAKMAQSMLLGLFWLGGAKAVVGAEDASPAPAPSLISTQTVSLEYRDLEYGTGNWGVPVALQTVRFKKDPRLGAAGVCRGTLKFGDSAGHFVPFLWDRAQRKLYLDLNRNYDLTDDAEGVFSCPTLGYSDIYQVFTNVHLTFKTRTGSQRALVDLTFNLYGSQPNVTASSRYCWEGKIAQPGQEWQFALIDNLTARIGSTAGGRLVIRPWAERNQPLNVQFGSLDAIFAQNLFFGQQAYQWACSPIEQDNQLNYLLHLKEYSEPLGELRVAGQYIKRLVLTRQTAPGAAQAAAQAAFARRYGIRPGATSAPQVQVASAPAGPPLTVVLDQPAGVVKVPLGSYQYQFTLGRGAAEATRLAGYGQAAEVLLVSATNAAVLRAGGPLTNSVTLGRRGRSLTLNYQLLGANGELYALPGERKEPEFAIYRPGKDGDKKLATGQFQFG